jgi:hypothetical protein
MCMGGLTGTPHFPYMPDNVQFTVLNVSFLSVCVSKVRWFLLLYILKLGYTHYYVKGD